MVVFPIATFYFLWMIVFDSDPLMLEWSGFGSVIAANIVIGLYVHMAWTEDQKKSVSSIQSTPVTSKED